MKVLIAAIVCALLLVSPATCSAESRRNARSQAAEVAEREMVEEEAPLLNEEQEKELGKEERKRERENRRSSAEQEKKQKREAQSFFLEELDSVDLSLSGS